MALLEIGRVPFDADLVAFDKDGTLIDFEFMWGRLSVAWVERLAADADNDALGHELYRSLGYDSQQQRTNPQSPLAIASASQLQTIAAAVLYCHGVPWPEAEERAQSTFRQTAADLPLTDLIRPTGDVAGLLEQLQGAGVRVAVITTDDRTETEETLRIMGVAHLVDHLICGGADLPLKPAPDTLLATCDKLGVEPAGVVMVGDTMADLLMARRAGAGLSAAVLTGVGGRALLKTHADVVLRSIDEIAVLNDAL